jgi:hypothetical protein
MKGHVVLRPNRNNNISAIPRRTIRRYGREREDILCWGKPIFYPSGDGDKRSPNQANQRCLMYQLKHNH